MSPVVAAVPVPIAQIGGDLGGQLADGRQRGGELAAHEGHRLARFAGRRSLAAAHDDAQARSESRSGLGAHQRVAFAMALTALRMAQDHESRTRIGHHRCRDITSMRPALGLVAILCADGDLLGLAVDRVDQRVGGRDRHLDLGVTLRRTVDRARFREHRAGAMHLPVSDDIGPAGHVCRRTSWLLRGNGRGPAILFWL